MNKFFSRILMPMFFFFYCLPLFAQDKPDMADLMRSNGKIYVVVGVCLIILAGLFLYVWRVDRKIKNIENKGNG
ncbi:MAG: CcmD family protein [Ferruginibacter sp.]